MTKENNKEGQKVPKKEEESDLNQDIIGNPLKMEYIKWIALPKPLRNPKTDQEWGEKNNTHPSTLSHWKKGLGFWEAVKKEIKEIAKDRTPNVIQAFYNQILKSGKAQEVKLWLQYFEDFTEKTKQEIDASDPIKQLMRQIYEARKSPVKPESSDPRGPDVGGGVHKENREPEMET